MGKYDGDSWSSEINSPQKDYYGGEVSENNSTHEENQGGKKYEVAGKAELKDDFEVAWGQVEMVFKGTSYQFPKKADDDHDEENQNDEDDYRELHTRELIEKLTALQGLSESITFVAAGATGANRAAGTTGCRGGAKPGRTRKEYVTNEEKVKQFEQKVNDEKVNIRGKAMIEVARDIKGWISKDDFTDRVEVEMFQMGRAKVTYKPKSGVYPKRVKIIAERRVALAVIKDHKEGKEALELVKGMTERRLKDYRIKCQAEMINEKENERKRKNEKDH